MALLGPEAEPLRGAGAHPLEEHVGGPDQLEHRGHRGGVLEVHRDARPAAGQQVGLPRPGARRTAGPLDAHDVGAQVGEHHRGVRTRPDPGQLDDPDAAERPGALSECVAISHGADSDSTAVR
jgi:hypothetical protein